MSPFFDGMVGIALGLVVIVFRRRIAEHIITFQNETFGFEFGDGWIRWSEFVSIVGGTFSIVLGLLVLTGIVNR